MKRKQIRNIALISVVIAMICVLLSSTVVTAKVVQVEISSREVISDLPELSRSGPYEVIKGILFLEVNPDDPANKLIVDLKYAPRNSRGNVEFNTEFELHKPVDADRGNHRLMYFVNNRGYKMAAGYSVKYVSREVPWGHFNAHTGKNWLYSQGWSFLWSGWNCDVIEDEQLLNIHIPVVTDNDKPIKGKVYAQIYSYSDDITYSQPLVWGGSIPYPPVSMDNAHDSLTMRQYPWDKPVEIPRSHWSFARFENGKKIPDPGYLYIKEGFRPGWLYDLVYMGKDPKPTGLGMAAIRDVVSFFKYEKADEKGVANPLANVIEYTYSWGH